MAAIIIPAHNEAVLLAATLSAVVAQAAPDDEIVVCANGCSDQTVAVAGSFAPRIVVQTIDRASKTAAINHAERVVKSFPRFYLDADVVPAPQCLARLKQALAEGGLLAVAPTPAMSFGKASRAVRAYYRIWLALPYCQRGMIGAGMYGLSAAGRARFADFPDVIADDGFVRRLFLEHERGRVSEALVTVRAPTTLHWLLKIKTRSRLGNLQLGRLMPQLGGNESKDYAGGLRVLLRRPASWPGFVIYGYVTLCARLIAARLARSRHGYGWERDLSTRVATTERAHAS